MRRGGLAPTTGAAGGSGEVSRPLRLHHIGLVVPCISEIAQALDDLGFQVATQKEPDPIQQVSARFVAIGHEQDLYIEMVEPDHPSSPVSGFLRRRGGGLHHLCFEVEDIDAQAEALLKSGAEMVCAPVECEGFDRSFDLHHSQVSSIAFFRLGRVLLIELLAKGR
jgi:methylmalonyl-CoA/ethylmalonyl-CoA epimerase